MRALRARSELDLVKGARKQRELLLLWKRELDLWSLPDFYDLLQTCLTYTFTCTFIAPLAAEFKRLPNLCTLG